jgi:RNase P subunit RPR2
MTSVCPSCKEANWLTKPDVAEVARDNSTPYTDITCENCGWIGEADDLEPKN